MEIYCFTDMPGWLNKNIYIKGNIYAEMSKNV